MAKKKEEEKAPAEGTEPQKKSGGAMKMILMIGLPIMIFQGALAWFLISSFAQPAQPVTEEKAEKKVDEEAAGILFNFNDVIVNPAGTAGARFLNANIVLEYTDADLTGEITEKEVQIRDALINLLVNKTIAEMDGGDDQAKIKTEIIESCNKILKKGKIRNVFFPSWVFQ